MENKMGKSWEWGHEASRCEGVHTYEGKLVWYLQMTPDWAGSAAREQSFTDFMINGSAVSCPKEVEDEVRAFLSLKLLAGEWKMEE